MAIRMTGLVSGMDTESIVKELMSAQRYKQTKIENNITKLEWKQEKWKALNTKIYSFYTTSLNKVKTQGNFKIQKAASSDEDGVEVTSKGTAPEGVQKVFVKAVANTQMITGSKLASTVTSSTTLTSLMTSASGGSVSIKVGDDTTSFSVTSSSTVADFVQALQNAGLNASYDTTQQRFFISAKSSGVENAFSISPSASSVDLSKLGLSMITAEEQTDGTVTVTADSNVSVVAPTDAKITYNGAEIESASNTISVNGLNLTVKEKSEGADTTDTSDDKPVSITVTRDVDAIYDMVKSFVTSYNAILKEMNEDYNADRAKGYEPLTDDQKEAMSDDEVTKWEDKIKDSLLRRDDTLNSVISSMRTTFSKSVSYNGKSYALSSFGITAPDYTEYGLLHIDGDSEDTLRSTYTDKLKTAITENPDAVMTTFSELASELYSDFTTKMKSNTLRSALTFYNDKEMTKTLKEYKSQLSDMEDKLEDLETRYYKQFTAMETAMQKLNSQSSSITSMLGTS